MSNLSPDYPSSRGGAPLVFWFLIAMGFAAFAPCIILPEWREYQALRLAEQREQFKVDQIREAVSTEQRRLDALRSDPAVVARLARREFAFHQPGEGVVAVPVAVVPEPGASFTPAPVEPPAVIRRWQRLLPEFEYDRVFCDDQTRTLVMAMSLGLISISLALFRRRYQSPGARARGPAPRCHMGVRGLAPTALTRSVAPP